MHVTFKALLDRARKRRDVPAPGCGLDVQTYPPRCRSAWRVPSTATMKIVRRGARRALLHDVFHDLGLRAVHFEAASRTSGTIFDDVVERDVADAAPNRAARAPV